MPLLHLTVLAIVQGITEFLPISSSAHLVLIPAVTGWPDQGLLIDVAVHVGTLGAVLVYFWRDVGQLLVGAGQAVTRRGGDGARLLMNVVIATLPLVIAGFVLHSVMPSGIRSVEVIAWATLVFGLLLWAADAVGLTIRRMDHMTWSTALIVGLFQVLALIPGTSRSGICMTAARLMGYERADAARFAMLLGIPAIAGAGVLAGIDLYEAGSVALTVDALVAAALAFVAALISIAGLMAWLRRASFAPFVIYRVLLGAGLLYVFYLTDFLG